MWYHRNVGGERCPIVDTFWQTETGGHVITPLPGATPTVPGSCTLPLPGIMAAIVDETGKDVPNGAGGMLVIKRPWPSMIRTIWGDPERFKKSYFPEEMGGTLYLAGDGAVRDAKTAYFRITGRIDDVLNVSGHRLGTMEIESALVSKTDLVAEAAVVGRPDDLTGEAICAVRGAEAGAADGRGGETDRQRAAQLGGQGNRPDRQAQGHPLRRQPAKTRSGKIMRRLLRSIAKGEKVTRTRARWRIRRSWTSCPRRTERSTTEKPAEAGFLHAQAGAYFSVRTQAASFFASASFTCAFAGMGTGPHTPEPPFMILTASLSAASFCPAYLAATSL
jgi:acetyl-CoA synthetase